MSSRSTSELLWPERSESGSGVVEGIIVVLLSCLCCVRRADWLLPHAPGSGERHSGMVSVSHLKSPWNQRQELASRPLMQS